MSESYGGTNKQAYGKGLTMLGSDPSVTPHHLPDISRHFFDMPARVRQLQTKIDRGSKQAAKNITCELQVSEVAILIISTARSETK